MRSTQTPAIKFADVQLTRYDPGDFLLRHADDKHDETRKAAYVLNLTPHWRAEWGGLLAFPDRRGHVAEGHQAVLERAQTSSACRRIIM